MPTTLSLPVSFFFLFFHLRLRELVTIEFLQATATALFCVSVALMYVSPWLRMDPGLSAKTGRRQYLSISAFLSRIKKYLNN